MPFQDSDSQDSSGSSEMDRYTQFDPNFPENDSCSEFSDEPTIPIQSLPSNERHVEIPGIFVIKITRSSYGRHNNLYKFL